MSNQIAQNYAGQIDQSLHALIAEYKDHNPTDLYIRPEPEEWSVMEVLAHIAEFPPYWLKAFQAVIQNPGQPFGRTHTDPARIAAIADHAHDALPLTLARIEQARAQTLEMLLTIEDSDWEKTGVHANRGVMNLHQMMESFVTKHLNDHTAQAHNALQTVLSLKAR